MFALLVVLLGASFAPAQVWENITPPGVNWPRAIAIDSTNGTTVYVLDQGLILAKSTDLGDTWTFLNFFVYPPSLALGLDPSNPQTIYVGGTRYVPGALIKSTNGGLTWTSADSGIFEDPNYFGIVHISVDPFDGNHVFADCYPKTYESRNGGGWWLPRSDMGNRQVHFEPFTPNVAYLRSIEEGPLSLFKTTNGGGTWFSISNGIPGNGQVYSLGLTGDPDTLYAGVISNSNRVTGIYKTTDGGGSWFETGVGYPDSAVPHGLVVNPDNHQKIFVAAGSPNPGRSDCYRSTDGGGAWSLFGDPLPGPGVGLVYSRVWGGTLIIIVEGSGVFRLKNVSLGVAKDESNLLLGRTELRIYPQPMHHVLTIQYALPRSGRVGLNLYDPAGRKVAQFLDRVQDKGEYRFSFPFPSDLPEGVYFVRLRGEGLDRVAKVVRFNNLR